MTKFKVGDRVRIVKYEREKEYPFSFGDDMIVHCGKIATIISAENSTMSRTTGKYHLDIDGQKFNWSDPMLERINYKLKKPTHIVVWDEGCGDPAKFFTDEKEAKEFIKELSEKSKVIKDSIVFAEVRNVKKMSITKTLKYSEHKI